MFFIEYMKRGFSGVFVSLLKCKLQRFEIKREFDPF